MRAPPAAFLVSENLPDSHGHNNCEEDEQGNDGYDRAPGEGPKPLERPVRSRERGGHLPQNEEDNQGHHGGFAEGSGNGVTGGTLGFVKRDIICQADMRSLIKLSYGKTQIMTRHTLRVHSRHSFSPLIRYCGLEEIEAIQKLSFRSWRIKGP